MRMRCTTMPVTPTMSASAQRAKSIGSTFSSIIVRRCPSGVSAANNGRAATGSTADLPIKGSACSRPQNDTSKRGLIKTMSAIPPPPGRPDPAVRRLALDLQVLIGGERAHPHIGDRVLGDARADPHQGAQIHDRREHRPIDRCLLYLEQDRLAFLRVALARLLQEQLVEIVIAAEGKGALRIDERLDAAGGIAGIPGADHQYAVQFLF